MGQWAEVVAEDGHRFASYVAESAAGPVPGIVILQEIFGVTPQLKATADHYGAQGYRVVVPALYDRIAPNYVLEYAEADLARAAKNQLRYDEIRMDLEAAVAFATDGAGVALLGFCWGGGLAYWLAQHCRVSAVVSYYGTNLAQYCRAAAPASPCLFHFGADDPMIDADTRALVRRGGRSEDQYYEYAQAGHAFANSARPSYRKAQAKLAEERTLAFLRAFLPHSVASAADVSAAPRSPSV